MDITISTDTLETLLYKAGNAGWEKARGIKTDEQVKAYVRGVVLELTGLDLYTGLVST